MVRRASVRPQMRSQRLIGPSPHGGYAAARDRPPGRNETVGDELNRPLQKWPPNGEALDNRLAPPTVPQRTTDHPEHTVERDDHDSQTSPEENDARIDDEPLHHEADRAVAGVTTTRKPAPGPHATRIVERARERNTVTEHHLDLTFQVG